MNVIWWLLVGLLAGAIARLIIPANRRLGCLGTLVLGLAGSLVGGWIGYILESHPYRRFSPAGLLGSILGALLILGLFRLLGVGGGTSGRRRW